MAVSLAAYVCGIQVFATGVVMLLDKKTRHLVAVRREKKNSFFQIHQLLKWKIQFILEIHALLFGKEFLSQH